MDKDWFETGWEEMIELIAGRAGVDEEIVKKVYSAMSECRLTDYDIEKDAVLFVIYGEER